MLASCATEPVEPKIQFFNVDVKPDEPDLLDVCAPLGGVELRVRGNRWDWFKGGRAWDTPETNCI